MSRKSIFLDANILSIFAEIGRLDLLLALFKTKRLHVSPAIVSELSVAVERGQMHLQDAVDLIGLDKPIQVTAPSTTESNRLKLRPSWMALGEAECIFVCQTRGWTFASFDRKAINYCIRENIRYLKLNVILSALWKTNTVTQNEVQQIVDEIEQGGRHIRDKDEIFN